MDGNHVKNIPILEGVGVSNLVDMEPWFDKVLIKISSSIQDKMFIDCGVNIGQTLIKVKNAMPGIKYTGFEPNPLCVRYAHQLILVNDLQQAVVFSAGIADKTQVLDLHLSRSNKADTGASMIAGFRSGVSYKIPSLFVDSGSLNIWSKEKIGCIKIDVEGGELEVIKSFKDLIVRDQPLIICEILPIYNYSNTFRAQRQDELINLLVSLKYSIYRISTMDGSLYPLKGIEIHSDLSLCNYIFAPSEVVLD